MVHVEIRCLRSQASWRFCASSARTLGCAPSLRRCEAALARTSSWCSYVRHGWQWGCLRMSAVFSVQNGGACGDDKHENLRAF